MKRLGTVTMILFALLGGAMYSCGGGDDGPADQYFWESLGSPGKGWGYHAAIAIDPSDNKPVVVFKGKSATVGSTSRPRVMKWSSGTSWTDMGFLTEEWGDMPAIVIDPSDNKPVVVFEDNVNNGRARVMKWSSGISWTDLGFPSTGRANGYFRSPSIALDPSDNKPVVVFADNDNGWRIHVKKWSSDTSWTDLGLISTGEGYFPAIAVDPSDDKPIVAFVDVANGQKAHVKKWSSGTSWTDLGFLSAGEADGTQIAMDLSDNKPVVVFVDRDGPSVHVKKWSNGTSWIDLGILSQRWSDSPSIAIDPSDNKPVVAFRDWANNVGIGNYIHVKKWSEGTSWIGIGHPSEGPSVHSSIAFDPSDNQPIVMYADAWEGDASVYVSKHP